jgi:hypothetical protein
MTRCSLSTSPPSDIPTLAGDRVHLDNLNKRGQGPRIRLKTSLTPVEVATGMDPLPYPLDLDHDILLKMMRIGLAKGLPLEAVAAVTLWHYGPEGGDLF